MTVCLRLHILTRRSDDLYHIFGHEDEIKNTEATTFLEDCLISETPFQWLRVNGLFLWAAVYFALQFHLPSLMTVAHCGVSQCNE